MDRLVLIKSDRTPAEMNRMARLTSRGSGPYWKSKVIKVGDKLHDTLPHETHHEHVISRIAHTVKPHEEMEVGYRGHDNEYYPERFMHHAVMHHERQNGQPRETDKVFFANHTLRQARHSLTAEHAARQKAGSERRAEGMAKFRELMRSFGRILKALHSYFRAPAINVEGHVYEGRPGENHGDVFDRMSDEHKRSHHMDDGFVGHDGNYYSRAVARHVVGQTSKPATKDPYISPGAATSEQLADEQRAHPHATPKKMPERLQAYGEKPTVLVKSQDEGRYLYHATHEWNAHDIAHDKLRPHKPWHGTDQSAWPDGSTDKRTYFNKDRDAVDKFHPEGGKPTVLRVHSSRADFKRESTGDHYVKHTIRPEHIEVETGDGSYKPLKQWAGINKSTGRRGRPVKALVLIKSDGPVAYKTTFQGLPISIENPKGSRRKWFDPDTGKQGSNKMLMPYGYFRGTTATDGDSVDVFVGPHEDAPYAYIIRQMKAPDFQHYDEDKVCLGMRSPHEAKRIYLAHYDDPRYFGRLDIVPMDKLREKLAENHRDGRPEPLKWGPTPEQHPTVGGTQA